MSKTYYIFRCYNPADVVTFQLSNAHAEIDHFSIVLDYDFSDIGLLSYTEYLYKLAADLLQTSPNKDQYNDDMIWVDVTVRSRQQTIDTRTLLVENPR